MIQAIKSVIIDNKTYKYFDITEAGRQLGVNFTHYPKSLKILVENALRSAALRGSDEGDVQYLADWSKNRRSDHSISFYPTRILMQDYTGVPSIVDLASMRDAMQRLGGDPATIKPMVPVDLIVDHSVQVDFYGTPESFHQNCEFEMHRNSPRYEFLKWGAKAFPENLRIVPPGKGICHQVNLEHLAKVVWSDGEYLYPDSLVGLDSHTTMINGLSVLGWGVGGIEAESVMLGQPVSMIIPEVIGVKLVGKLRNGVNATDIVLAITSLLRKKGVVGKFVEYFGEGASRLSIADRATIANMSPEYGATCGFFPTDEKTLEYLRITGRDESLIKVVEAYAKAQGLWGAVSEPIFTDMVELDLAKVDTCLAGPKRPQDLLMLSEIKASLEKLIENRPLKKVRMPELGIDLTEGDVVIAAITSCTNTSNPDVMLGAGLVAKKACELGLRPKKYVKTSLAPGSRSVMEYLHRSGLDVYLKDLGFHLVGYGCTTCIGNSGPLMPEIEDTIKGSDMIVSAVLSGNRNFEGRIHPLVQANYLASPPLVVAMAIAGTVCIDFDKQPITTKNDGTPIFLRDLLPSNEEVAEYVGKYISADVFSIHSQSVFDGTKEWQRLGAAEGVTYPWAADNLYVQKPPYFDAVEEKKIEGSDSKKLNSIMGANILAIFGDSVTTDHISPAGNIAKTSPAAQYLMQHGVKPHDFNTYGARRGNHEVMMRGTFANIRIRNKMQGITKEGGYTVHIPTKEEMPIYDAAMLYKDDGMPVVVFAGKEYGSGSSRDWAAKGVMLLGVKAVIAESFERIHRSNLVGMGILPLEFIKGTDRNTLGITGHETVDIKIDAQHFVPNAELTCVLHKSDESTMDFKVRCRIDTETEIAYYVNNGILIYALRGLLEHNKQA